MIKTVGTIAAWDEGLQRWIFSSTFPLEIRKWPTYTFSLWSLFISVGRLSITAIFPPLAARRMEQISFACSELYYLWSTPHYLNGDSVCVCVRMFNGKQAVRIKIDVQQSLIVVYSTASSYGLHWWCLHKLFILLMKQLWIWDSLQCLICSGWLRSASDVRPEDPRPSTTTETLIIIPLLCLLLRACVSIFLYESYLYGTMSSEAWSEMLFETINSSSLYNAHLFT